MQKLNYNEEFYEKNIPKFDTEDEEREFWSTADSTEYIDWSKAKKSSLSESEAFAQRNICMNFEWDENKRYLNLQKHGLDFEDAKEIFTDDAFIIEDNRKNYGEIRYILYGHLCKRIVVVVFTMREKNIIRIISMRKANKREQNDYKKRLKQNRPDVG